MQHTEDQDLPLDIWIHVLSHAGSKAICSAACVCKRMRDAAQHLANHTIFASAGSDKEDIVDAIEDATERAMEGMLGAVDFALLFTNKQDVDDGPPQADGVGLALKMKKLLPEGVLVVGCYADGVASLDSHGNIMNRDPGDDQAVAVLLGRMPGVEVRPLLHWDGMLPSKGKKKGKKVEEDLNPLKEMSEMMVTWLRCETASGQPTLLEPQAIWLMVNYSHEEEFDPKKFRLNGPVTGGIADSFTFALGKYQNMIPKITRKPKQVGCLGLAFCLPATNDSTHDCGNTNTNAMSGASSSRQAPASTAATTATANPGMKRSLRTCATTLRGYAPVTARSGWVAPVLYGPQIDPAPNGWPSVKITGGRYTRCSTCSSQQGQSADSQYLKCFLGACQQNSEASLMKAVAVWRDDCMPGRPDGPVTWEMLQSENCILLHPFGEEYTSGERHIQFSVAPGTHDDVKEKLDKILELGDEHVRAQIVAINEPGVKQQLPALANFLTDACISKAAPGQVDIKQDIYESARSNALLHGARSGPAAMALFSCNGRGQAVFATSPQQASGSVVQAADHSNTAISEAGILDKALDQRIPFIYGAFGGEIGPSTEDAVDYSYISNFNANSTAQIALEAKGCLTGISGQQQSVCVVGSANIYLTKISEYQGYTTQMHMVA